MPGRVRILLAYQGSRYSGWQVQPEQVTIQELLQDAYRHMTGLDTAMLAAARTDAGVHAEGQVVCFDNPSRHSPEKLLEGLNHYLPEDVAIVDAETVKEDYDPRRQAAGKHYRYVIWNRRVRPVFSRQLCWHVRQLLREDAMNRAARALLGEHDFSAFRASGCTAASPVRRLDSLAWHREGPFLVLDVFGRAFLKQMVRNIVGTLVEVGRGRLPGDELAPILASGDRRRAGPTAPARGLCLVKVYLDEYQYRADAGGIGGDTAAESDALLPLTVH